MKNCLKCNVYKHLSEFYADKTYSDGYQSWCKPCTLQRRRDRARGIPLDKVPEGHKRCNGCKIIKLHSDFWADLANKTDGRYSHCKKCKTNSTNTWRKNNADYYNASMKAYRDSLTPEQKRDIEIKKWFDLPSGWWTNKMKEQDNKCGICGKINTAKKRSFAIDHHHKTGKIRDVLCYKCNRDLNPFDDKEQFKRIIDYLKKHGTWEE